MASQPLPERANIEQLKKQAKSLLHAARGQDQAALARFRAVPALARNFAAGRPPDLALHDAQFAIAREYGFQSWNEMREHVEDRSLSFSAAVDEFVRCATGGAQARAMRLLAAHPDIAHASIFAELALVDVDAVEARLKARSEAAVETGGAQNWEPILYVCHTCLHKGSPERTEALAPMARALLRRGANPNAEYHWNWHPELPRTALWGALMPVGHLPLAEALLEAGANPTDGVSMHIAAGSNNIPVLDLLGRYGMNANGIPGGVPPLRYMMTWAPAEEDPAGARWLLEHGADANLAWGEFGDAPIHIAAERWPVTMMELLTAHGADIHQRRADGRTAHTLAAWNGNGEVAAWLLRHGAKDELSELDKFCAACTRGDKATADAMLAEHPNLRGELRPEHHLMLGIPAARGDAKALETMLAGGFDPNVKDHDGVTALHRAAMAGRPEAARVLLAHGADVNALDGMFAATPLVWVSEGWRHGPKPGVDHVGAARVLLAAGSSREWEAPEKAPDPESTQERLIELCRAADAP